jgi:uncharacterized membrane protein YjfL (UPF0719 family)
MAFVYNFGTQSNVQKWGCSWGSLDNANMKTKLIGTLVAVAVALAAVPAQAQEATAAAWRAKTLGEAVFHTAVFGLVGVVLAIVGYKLFDLATPGKLHHEILQNKNLAAGIIGAAIILGVCLLVAAAMVT